MSTAVKPQLRGLLHNQIKRNLIMSLIVGGLSGVIYKYTVCDPSKKLYLEFNKNYDIDKEFNLIRNTGVLKSCPPDP